VTRDDSFADEAAFYSRRIGRAPRATFPRARAPLATTILGAAKLFGRTASGWRAGVLAAATGSADATSAAGDTRVAAPTGAVIARVVREADAGNAAVGMFASGLRREVEGRRWPTSCRETLARSDSTGRSVGRADLRGARVGARHRAEGSSAAIARLAMAPWHDLERSDCGPG